jgi:hypothetical protein
MAQKSTQQKFQFLTEKHIKANLFQLKRWQAAKLREKLPKGIYWVQITHGGQYHWNWTLLHDYIFNGDRPEHKALVEEYLASRP